jgi:hypothetical protein
MRQLAIAYDDRSSWSALLACIDDAVTHLGLKEVCHTLDVAKSTVCDALHDRNDRRWAGEWTIKVLEMLRDRYSETSNQHMRAILDAHAAVTRRFEVVPVDDVPSEAEIAAAERVLSMAKRRRRAA